RSTVSSCPYNKDRRCVRRPSHRRNDSSRPRSPPASRLNIAPSLLPSPQSPVPTMIETRDLTKKYGELFAVKSLDIKLEPGDVFGFIGPNGAGKTTAMKILATLLNPTWGEAYICGNSIYTRPKEIRRLIGFMPDFFGVY